MAHQPDRMKPGSSRRDSQSGSGLKKVEDRNLEPTMRPAVVLAAILLATPLAAQQHGSQVAGTEMVRIPAGRFVPLYDRGEGAVRVAAFRLDRDPVTRGQFLEFVRRNPRWRRDSVKRVLADASYLAGWAAPLEAGSQGDLARPVTSVSWFAAAAYCRAEGKRLPTVDEWEYVASANATMRDATRDPEATRALLATYARPRPDPLPAVGHGTPNVYGVRDMHGMVWEWTQDFNSVLVSDDSRGTGGREQQLFCASGAVGATNTTNYPSFLRHAVRAGLEGRTTMSSLGFRCAAN